VASSCANHPDRPAHALCMSCRRAVCQECATTWDGIHYCSACLARRRELAGASTAWAGWLLVVGASAGIFWFLARVMVWAGVAVVESL